MVEKRLYLIKDGELWFSDQVLVIDGDDFKRKSLHYAHLGDKTTKIAESTFEGNYLGGTVNDTLSFPEELMTIEK